MKSTWQFYSETIFRCCQWLPEDLCGFIITAYNPMGQNQAASCNQLADANLLAELEARQLVFRAITGYSPDFNYGEAGWFVFADLMTAEALAKQFNQLAIYWLDHGELILHPCQKKLPQAVSLGPFKKRLQYQI